TGTVTRAFLTPSSAVKSCGSRSLAGSNGSVKGAQSLIIRSPFFETLNVGRCGGTHAPRWVASLGGGSCGRLVSHPMGAGPQGWRCQSRQAGGRHRREVDERPVHVLLASSQWDSPLQSTHQGLCRTSG